MGGGDKTKTTREATQQEALHLEVFTDFERITPAQTDVMVLATVTAAPLANEERRAPITICAAIDRSGSMKEHLPLLKETLKFMVQQLRADDRLSLISFDHEVKVELPLTNMDAAGKSHAEKAIDSMRDRGQTNLSGGLIAALQQFYNVPAGEASLVESVLLFTDGKANVGITDTPTNERATRSMLTQIGRQTCVFTFGYGGEHDANMLRAIADAGSGLYYYIENVDCIPDSFCDCLGGLLSVSAQNIQLTFMAAGDVMLHHPLTPYKVTAATMNKQYHVTIPDIYCEEEKSILIKATVPKNIDLVDVAQVNVLTCHIQYFDVIECLPRQSVVAALVIQDKACVQPVLAPTNDQVQLQLLRVQTAETIDQANDIAKNGNLNRARDMLNACLVRIEGSQVRCHPLAMHLTQTVQDSVSSLANRMVYLRIGQSQMTNYSHSHMQQRSNTDSTQGAVLCPLPTSQHLVPPGGATAMEVLRNPTIPACPSEGPRKTSPYRISSKAKMMNKYVSSK